MNCIDLATKIIAAEEGFSCKVYRDTEGYPTIGFGLKVGDKDEPFPRIPRMPKDVAYVWLKSIVMDVEEELGDILNNWDEHSALRQAVLVSMGYQLGLSGLQGFTMTLNSFEQKNYVHTSIHMLDSLWARQTPRRAERHARMMEDNKLCPYYLI